MELLEWPVVIVVVPVVVVVHLVVESVVVRVLTKVLVTTWLEEVELDDSSSICSMTKPLRL